MLELRAQPLTREAFAPFGDVIETAGSHNYPINQGSTIRFHDLANIDTAADGGRTLISAFRATPLTKPIVLRGLERHPIGSQAFMPLNGEKFLVVVADSVAKPSFEHLHAFITDGKQGVNYARNTWHHFVLALDRVSDFLVVDRGGPGANCEEITLAAPVVLTA